MDFSRNRTFAYCHNSPWRAGGELGASGYCVNSPRRVIYSRGELHSDSTPVSRSCIFFAYFCFELDFDVNIKVVDNFVSFLMALV
ncbi:hypothetical protein MTR_4g048370 [Medicago truncatula]|uniref:Uncharacterized protein n=1 Tax=Medicago truncatula TaxID=3880 RepID=A0A072UJ21_MEDTR|nr:hypothetical protein MTR_4g048370 [Medicago truncatula]